MLPSRAHRTRIGLCLALTALGLAACDSSSGPSDTDHGLIIDPCNLFTRAEAETILAKPVLTVKKDTSEYILTCTYAAELNVRVAVKSFTSGGVKASQGAGSTFSPQSYLGTLKTALDAADWENVSGVGTEAIWAVKSGKLTFYKGDVVSEILVSPTGRAIDTSSAARAGAIAAGTTISAKL